ncbi:MAG: NAD-dependent epimerase/dehydratase family protein [bacterium]|nr:NAD-dependent epimerase/dehydratase family protein [bacterium]
MEVVVAGYGWLGRALGRGLVERGHRVIAVRRSRLEPDADEADVRHVRLDLSVPGAWRALPPAPHAIVACQAADERSVEGYERAYLRVNEVLREYARQRDVERFVYTGSTGVFGCTDGRDVDEQSAIDVDGGTAGILAQAEDLVLGNQDEGPRGNVVRLSGLYGPGRYGIVDRVRRGALALGPGDDAWMNWCHRSDAVTTLLAVVERGRAGAVYHASDAFPERRRDVVAWIAERLGIAAPRAAGGAKPGDARPRTNRRIRAEKTRAELGIVLAYPSFREGLGDPDAWTV